MRANRLQHAVHERAGEPAEEIVAAAAAFDSDLVVLGVRKRSPVGKVLFGSVTQAVIFDTDRPVTAVAPADNV
ncbi:universal stress protein [Natrarchaeobaculum sulfurireducens]|uniref:Nucleotide-binding protein, UspA family n=1 Tax=Natrarchaeobaculum sulfurireducens TaxID=2044521 RepID=A0A346PND4_9EURY|nr:universal stress protein [Natrarchaeobaculum sulfurireducens]AXR78925.1 Nucleotide-binding protein, UspA family [Natrarchaeobaculum sulfurireducens]AXR81029.1 Universal stress protein [Natrarchaeobaculum sulfurireducens]